MQGLTLTNSSVTATPSAAALSAAPDILSGLGFEDQRAEVIAEEQTANHQYVRLRSAIEKFAVTPNAKNKIKLTQVLNKEIKRLQKEYDYIKAKQLEYQQAAEQEQSSSNYVAQWRDWFTSGVKQFFGSDNAHQAQRYAAIAEARQEQVEKLKQYRDEVKAKNKAKQNKPKESEEDVVELNTDDASPMRRRLLTLPVANEFQVNIYTTSSQNSPKIAMQPNGNFIIAWTSDGQDGSLYGIYARRFGSNGFPIDSIEFPVNIFTVGFQYAPTIATQSNGDFVIAWANSGPDGSQSDIYGRHFNSTSSVLSPEFRINDYTIGFQFDPVVGMQPNNTFIIAWASAGQDGSGQGVYARHFNATGSPLGPEFRVNTNTTADQSHPAIAVQPWGDFVITWQSFGQDTDGLGIYAQRFNATGSQLGLEFRVNTNVTSDQSYPAITSQPSGNFIITWQSSGQDNDGLGVYAQLFNATGSPVNAELRVNTNTTSGQYSSSIGVQTTGNFVISWAGEQSGYGVYIRQFNATGKPLGREFLVSTNTMYSQHDPAIGIQPTGSFVITYSSYEQDGNGYGIYARIFRPLNMGNYTLTVNQGQNTTVTTSMIDATSGGTASDISFTVSNVVNGRFEFSNNPGVAITQFNKQEIIDGIVRFVHNGSPNAPSFSIAATDGNETLVPYTASINFISTPAVSSSTGIAVPSSSSSGNAQSSSGNNAVSSTAPASSTAASAVSSSAANGASSSSGADEKSSSSTALAAPNSASSSSANNQPPSSTSVVVSSSTAENAAGGNGGGSSSDTTTQTAIIAGASVGGVAILSVFGIFACRAQYQKIKLLREKEQAKQQQARQQKDEKVEFVRMAHEPNQDGNKSAMQVGDSKNSAKKNNERLTVELVSQPPRANEISASSSAPVHTPPPMQPRPGLN